MRRRVFVVAAEFGSNPRFLPPARRAPERLAEAAPEPPAAEVARAFFRYPNRSEDGRARPADWERDFGFSEPVSLVDLLASAGHRALSSLHALLGARDYRSTCERVTDLVVTSMPGLDPNERMNVGLVPQTLQAALQLPRRARCQFVAGTSDSGAWAFAQAVRSARTAERGATVLVLAGQIIPSGYASQYQIRTVLGDADQAQGLDMLVVGDLLMDCMRRNLGPSREEIERALAAVSARKFQGAAAYPAAMLSGRLPRRDTRRTPYFDGEDIAAPCCGAAATLVTSDEALVDELRGARSRRHRGSTLVEVLGVGEGSSNPSFLARQSPLLFATAVREAFTAGAEDAGVPVSTFTGSSFAVVHDAFPSIELAFLTALGLDFERAVERMRDGWSNPYGGLLTFGHALGASGLVQVNKTHHVFSGDARYLRQPDPAARGPLPGGLAFTTSVGGPLSHVVVTLFRGGDGDAFRSPGRASAGSPWVEQRRMLRAALPAHLSSVEPRLAGGRPVLVEGLTYVSIRSCLRALAPREIAALEFDGLEFLVRPERLGEVRERLRELVALVVAEAERLASLFDVFRVLTDELQAMAREWHGDGVFAAEVSELPPERVAERLKECLRVPLAVLVDEDAGRTRRRVTFLPRDGLGYAALEHVDLLVDVDGRLVPAAADAGLLPWWSVRAGRPPGAARPRGLDAPPVAETAGDLGVLRAGASLVPRAWALELSGALEHVRPRLRAFAVVAEVLPDAPGGLPAAQEALAAVAREARAWLGAWTPYFAQGGTRLWVGGTSTLPGEASEALRFARELARGLVTAGLRVRLGFAEGEGRDFLDVDGRVAVASDVMTRAGRALGAVVRDAGLAGAPAALGVDGPAPSVEGWAEPGGNETDGAVRTRLLVRS